MGLHNPDNYLHLVQYVLNKHYGGGHATAERLQMEVDDLRQVGCIGLIKACNDYDPSREAKFETYAFIKIHGEILRYIRDDCYVAKFSKRVREIAIKARKLENRSPEGIAVALEIPADVALDVYYYLNRKTLSLFAEIKKEETLTYADVIPGGPSAEDVAITYLDLEERLCILSDNQRLVCRLSLDGNTQVEIAKELGISQSHVGRLMKKAITTIQREYEVID